MEEIKELKIDLNYLAKTYGIDILTGARIIGLKKGAGHIDLIITGTTK
jgi:hypothetical protein